MGGPLLSPCGLKCEEVSLDLTPDSPDEVHQYSASSGRASPVSFAADCLHGLEASEHSRFSESEHFGMLSLMEREPAHMAVFGYWLRQPSIVNPATRRQLVDWLLKMQIYHGLAASTVLLAINYLDRFLTIYLLPPKTGIGALEMIFVACISIATKMEGGKESSPEEPSTVAWLQGCLPSVDPKEVQEMESLILSTLEWRVSSVTPLSYISYFLRRFSISSMLSADVEARVVDILLEASRQDVLMRFRPSALAASAFRAALEELSPLQSHVFWRSMCNLLDETAAADDCYYMLHLALGPAEDPLASPPIHRGDPACCGESGSHCPQPVSPTSVLGEWGGNSTPVSHKRTFCPSPGQGWGDSGATEGFVGAKRARAASD